MSIFIISNNDYLKPQEISNSITVFVGGKIRVFKLGKIIYISIMGVHTETTGIGVVIAAYIPVPIEIANSVLENSGNRVGTVYAQSTTNTLCMHTTIPYNDGYGYLTYLIN